MADSYEPTNTKPRGKKVVSRSVCILLTVLALVLGGLAGYAYGKSVATTDSEEALQQRVSSLEDDLDQAKAAANNKVQDSEEDSAQDQETIDALKSENATLKQTITDQNEKIADLQRQLDEANNSNSPQ
jgi:uncharacterized protein HemX